jgi:hypothetical protein
VSRLVGIGDGLSMVSVEVGDGLVVVLERLDLPRKKLLQPECLRQA